MKEVAREKLKERIAPGIWVDTENGLHISLPELLEVHGFEDNEENRQICLQAAKEVLARMCPNAEHIYREHPDSKGVRL